MIRLRDLPIRRKLTLVTMATTSLALGLACAAFTIYDQFALRRDLVDQLSGTARMIGYNSASALSFNDEHSAEQTLGSLAAQPNIIAAWLHGRDGKVFARYFRGDARSHLTRPGERVEGATFAGDAVELVSAIDFGGEVIGALHLQSDLVRLRDRLMLSATIFIAVMLGGGIIAYLFVSRLQRIISQPVQQLAVVAGQVAAAGDYRVRAVKHGNDEVGTLIDGFNAMLAQIEMRDAALQQAREELERRVEARTEQIQRERARFKFIFDSVPVGISLVVPGEAEAHVVNPAHTRITGISPAQLEDPTAFERASHPEDFARQRELVRRYKRGEIDHFSLEKRYLHADGHIVWAALSRRMFLDPTTGQRQSVTTVIDVSELKAAQEEVARERARFKFIFDSVPIGISCVLPGQDGAYLVNPAHARITGVSVEDSKQPGIFARVSHPEDLARQREFIARYSAGEIDHYTIEKRYVHAGGAIVWASLTSRLFTDPLTLRRQSITTLVDITERKAAEARLADTHRQLLETSRQAGMAEVATGVLHNVGNVLNSVNVSTTLLTELVRQSKVPNLARLAELLAGHEADAATFFASDPRGRKIPGFVSALAKHLTQEQQDSLAELESLRKSVEHIKEIVAMQQNYAKVSGVTETLAVSALIEDALRMNTGAMARHDIALVRDFRADPMITVEKHKVLQILINLLRNAKYACDDAGRGDKAIVIRIEIDAGQARIAVIDNGVGIPAENLTRIFSHGFTTRKNGHGFGLHSGALAARELGGRLFAESDGAGRGATFILELPLRAEARAA